MLAGSATTILGCSADDEHGKHEHKIGRLDVAAVNGADLNIELEEFVFHGSPLFGLDLSHVTTTQAAKQTAKSV